MKLLAFALLVLLLAKPVYGHDYFTGLDAYSRGEYAAALKEWRPLAEQGLANAQNSLGFMYDNGEGVPQNYVQAHMWFNLAASGGNEYGRGNRDNVAQLMTPAQIAEAQRLAREWQQKAE